MSHIASMPDPSRLAANRPDPGRLVANRPDPGRLAANRLDPWRLLPLTALNTGLGAMLWAGRPKTLVWGLFCGAAGQASTGGDCAS